MVIKHARIVHALIMREIMTRYGREGIGFMWVVAEPLIFCFGVLIMWHFIKPAYEHGVRLGPFVMTGYMSLLLLRHLISQSVAAINANSGLLYHAMVRPLHIFMARTLLEFFGATIAFLVVYLVLYLMNEVALPHDMLLLVGGWLIVLGLGCGLSLIFGALVLLSDVFERLVAFLSYALIPISGAFIMASFLPDAAREIYLRIPFPHGVEMIRDAVFGEFVQTYYDVGYALFWVLLLNLLGLAILSLSVKHIEVD